MRIAPKKRVKHSWSMPTSRTEVAMAAMTGSVEVPVASATQNDCSKASRSSAVSGPGFGPARSTMSSARRASA